MLTEIAGYSESHDIICSPSLTDSYSPPNGSSSLNGKFHVSVLKPYKGSSREMNESINQLQRLITRGRFTPPAADMVEGEG